MKPIHVFILLLAAAASRAQVAVPQPAGPGEPPGDTVIAVYEDGYTLTYGEMRIFMSTMPAEMQQAAMRDRKSFVSQFGLMRKLSALAEKDGLHEQSPSKEIIQFQRMQVLTGAQINRAMDQIRIPPEEIAKQYEAGRERYTQVRVKAIYISFVSGPAPTASKKKALTEAEARIKMEKLAKEVRAGADFVKMVKLHSEDQTSAAKDGDFGNIRRSDSLPDAVRNAIFALKEGEVSEPVRQPNGYYLFRAEKVATQPLPEVRDEIFNELKQTSFRKWMEEMQASAKLQTPEAAPPAR